jgi:hypothetical protein
MTTTYKKLLASRCTSEGKPTFWKPQQMLRTPHTLFNDEDIPVLSEWGVEQAIERTLALACELEIPVGGWLGAASKRESEFFNENPLIKKLALTNISDETFHDQGVQDAAKVYQVASSTKAEAALIRDAWFQLDAHPLQKAAWAEVAVFLISLAILRLAGGSELAAMSEQISMDESRHVATNRGLLRDLGLNALAPSAPVQGLIDETLDWVTQGICIPANELCTDFDFDTAFLKQSSQELILQGVAPRLNSLMDLQVHTCPFEISNRKNYSRATVEELVAA